MSTNEEGARGFAVTLQQIDEGRFHAEVSEAVHALNRSLDSHATTYGVTAKGELTLVLRLAASPNGTVQVLGEVRTKTPKPPRSGSVFWLTRGLNLSPENPKQTKLPLQQVAPPETRTVPADVRRTEVAT